MINTSFMFAQSNRLSSSLEYELTVLGRDSNERELLQNEIKEHTTSEITNYHLIIDVLRES